MQIKVWKIGGKISSRTTTQNNSTIIQKICAWRWLSSKHSNKFIFFFQTHFLWQVLVHFVFWQTPFFNHFMLRNLPHHFKLKRFTHRSKVLLYIRANSLDIGFKNEFWMSTLGFFLQRFGIYKLQIAEVSSLLSCTFWYHVKKLQIFLNRT